jgi:hypothetical protein
VEERKCAGCRRPFSYPAYEKRTYCSADCANSKGRDLDPPDDEFHQFLFDQWCDSGLAVQPYARQLGLTAGGFRRLVNGGLPLRRTLERLEAFYGAALPATPTETERRPAMVMALQPGLPKAGTPEIRARARKAGDTMRGQRRPGAGAKMVATKRARGLLEKDAPRLRALARQPKVRARAALGFYLHLHPTASLDDLRQRAKRVAPGLGLTANGVWAEWVPVLDARGPLDRGGGQANERRHDLLDRLMADWPRSPAGKLKRGFWGCAADQVYKVESAVNPEAPCLSGPQLQEWYRRHTREPGRCGRAA